LIRQVFIFGSICGILQDNLVSSARLGFWKDGLKGELERNRRTESYSSI
jgi:hypothetical protein